MQQKTIGCAQRWIEVKAGNLFNYNVDDDSSAIGFRLAHNNQEVAALAFTHSPRASAQMPALVTIRYFANDQAVFVYENAAFSPDQNRHGLSRDSNIPAGAFISTAAGSYLRCIAGTQAYNIDLMTGEISGAIGQQAIWTLHWRLLDCFEGVIYQQ